MGSLKDTKTHSNLKDAFAGESQANRRYLYFANKAARRRKVKPAMPTATSITLSRLATRRRDCLLAIQH